MTDRQHSVLSTKAQLTIVSRAGKNIGQWPESSAAFYYVPVNGGGCRTEYIVLVGGVDVNMFNCSQCAKS